jgi:hypothetical protein
LGDEKRGEKLSQNGLNLSTKAPKTVTKRARSVDWYHAKPAFVSINTGIGAKMWYVPHMQRTPISKTENYGIDFTPNSEKMTSRTPAAGPEFGQPKTSDA